MTFSLQHYCGFLQGSARVQGLSGTLQPSVLACMVPLGPGLCTSCLIWAQEPWSLSPRSHGATHSHPCGFQPLPTAPFLSLAFICLLFTHCPQSLSSPTRAPLLTLRVRLWFYKRQKQQLSSSRFVFLSQDKKF